MDYKKIGNFISSERKNKKMTQAKLAEKIFISEKTLSKWENGNGIPDTSTIIRLCDIFGVSINEFLTGERSTGENQNKNDKILLDMAKELEQKNKIIWKSMWVIMCVSIIALLAGLFLTRFFIPAGVWQIVSILALCIVFLPDE